MTGSNDNLPVLSVHHQTLDGIAIIKSQHTVAKSCRYGQSMTVHHYQRRSFLDLSHVPSYSCTYRCSVFLQVKSNSTCGGSSCSPSGSRVEGLASFSIWLSPTFRARMVFQPFARVLVCATITG